MSKFLLSLVLGFVLFTFSGCQTIQSNETVLITKKNTYPGRDTSITLYMSPCVNEKVKALLDNDLEMLANAGAAKGYTNGKDYAGCYLVDFNEGIIYFLDETGQSGRISIDQFEPAPKE